MDLATIGCLEGVAAPQGERLGQDRTGAVWIAGTKGIPAAPAQSFEFMDIDVSGLECQPVARRRLLDQISVAERAAQSRNERLQRVRLVSRRTLAPHGIDQGACGDRLWRLKREKGEQRPQPRTGDLDVTVSTTHLERSEHGDLHNSQYPSAYGPLSGADSARLTSVNEVPPEIAEAAKRRLAAARALDMRNNLYGAAAAYLAWALEVLVGLNPLDTAHSLMDGATVESLLVGHLPVSEPELDRLRAEVQQMSDRVRAMTDPSQRAVDAVANMNEAVSLIEAALAAS